MKRFIVVLEIMLVSLSSLAQKVKTGIDVLEENGFMELAGKKIALVTNPTGVDHSLKSTIDILYNAPEVTLAALFGPEHGIRGSAHAGEEVSDYGKDPSTGLPIYSFYGKSRFPSSAQLEGVDAIVYDIQDIGCRSYTYISTMGNMMKIAAAEGIEMIILDRPNPLGGVKVEGCGVESDFISFVSPYDIPYIYGLTCGELATLINEEGLLSVKNSEGEECMVKCNLKVVKMKGWKRKMNFDDTGLPWVPTSPHIPSPESAYLYPATGILGELGICSIGVGYTLPFQMIAFKGIDAEKLAADLNALSLPGVLFRPIYAVPFYGSSKGKEVAGVQIYITDFAKVHISEIQFRVLEIVAASYPDIRPFSMTKTSRLNMFDKVCGTKNIREAFSLNYKFKDIEALWNYPADLFKRISSKYYLYK